MLICYAATATDCQTKAPTVSQKKISNRKYNTLTWIQNCWYLTYLNFLECSWILCSFGWDSYNSDTLGNWLQANNNWLHLRFQCMRTWVLPVALQLLFEANEAIVHNLGKTFLYTGFRRKVIRNVALPLGAWASLKHSRQKKSPFPQSTAWDVRGGALGENIFITFGWPLRM
jgi:hypothetical protein